MLVALTQLAHDVLIWARRWLAVHAPRACAFGLKRLVRDVFGVRGVVERAPCGEVLAVGLHQADPLAPHLLAALRALAAATAIPIRLGDPSAMPRRGGVPPRAHAAPPGLLLRLWMAAQLPLRRATARRQCAHAEPGGPLAAPPPAAR